jgi:hypothetical protein
MYAILKKERNMRMKVVEVKQYLQRRKEMLEQKLESKKEPHFYGVNPVIISDTEAKLDEIEMLLEKLEEIE